MAGPLKRYGQYFVFAAMATTGVLVWNSNRRDLNGESYAELWNAAAERYVVTRLLGAETPIWPELSGGGTNMFSSAVLTKEFRDGLQNLALSSYILGSTSAYSTSNGDPGLFTPDLFSASVASTNPIWLVDYTTLTNGSSAFVSNDSGFYASGSGTDHGFSYTNYGVYYSNRVDGATSTRTTNYDPEGIQFPGGVPKTNQALTALNLSYASRAAGFSVAVPGGSTWTTNMGPFAFVSTAFDKPLSRVFARNDILQPVAAISNLVVSASAVMIPDVSYEYSYTATGVRTTSDYTTDLSSYLADCAAATYSGYATNTRSFANTPYVNQFDYAGTAAKQYDRTTPVPPISEGTTVVYSRSRIRPLSFVAGQYFGYPSAYAVTNGYVKRIQIFAVFDVSLTLPYSDVYLSVEKTNMSTYAFNNNVGYTLSDLGFVSFSHPLSEVLGLTPPSDSGYMAPWAQLTPMSPVLALLYDVVDPSSSTELLWSEVTPPTMTESGAPQVYCRMDYTGGFFPADTNRLWDVRSYRASTIVRVQAARIFSVVTWNWKHLNPDNPYVPPE